MRVRPKPPNSGAFDLVAGREAVTAATHAGIRHFVYVSVAHPAPNDEGLHRCTHRMRKHDSCRRPERHHPPALVHARAGHRWPYAILPFYWLLERLPASRQGARRVGLVTFEQMLVALTNAVDNPCEGQRVLSVPEIRRGTFDTPAVTVTA